MLNRITYSSLAILAFVFFIFSCTKKDAGPIEISIAKITDSLMLRPISFFAYVSQTPDSYAWNFGDGSTSTEISPKHTYQKLGAFYVGCIVKKNGVSYGSSYTLYVQGDGRLVDQRHYTGVHTYRYTVGSSIVPITATRLVADTMIQMTTYKFGMVAFKNGMNWQSDDGTEVIYNSSYEVHLQAYLKYYPKSDSVYLYYNHTDQPGTYQDKYELTQKK